MPLPQIGAPAPDFTAAALLPDKSFAVSALSHFVENLLEGWRRTLCAPRLGKVPRGLGHS